MEERISAIKKVELKKEDMLSMIMFERSLTGSDLKFLEDEFDFYKEDVNKFVANYKNVGIVFKLSPLKEELLADWKIFAQKVIKKTADFDKFHNIFVSKSYDKVLLVTNKRLLKVDLEKLNEKIEEINYRIESFDEKVEVEMDDLAEATKDKRGFFGKLVEVFKK